jgi:hypothetical protein
VPAGYSGTPDGAAAAAANYVVVLSGPLTVSDATRAATLSASSATDVAPAVAERFAAWQRVERLTGLIAAVESGLPKVLSTAVLGTRVRSFTPERAVIDVWAVSAVGTSTTGRVDSMWSTETVELGWEGNWKVRNYSSANGPVPAQQQPVTPFAQFLAAVSDMAGTGHVSPR